ncbi:MAG: SDR family oxidoreductase [Actinobacteria bacterium]|nr:SDR family oxidoreductase [Actinomycetota bacterium]
MSLPSPAADRTCLVTGASSGIGADIARQLAGRGLGVTLVARREDLLRALAGELASAHGVRAEVVVADLADEQARAALASEIEGLGLTVDVLVNNAGFSTTGAVHAGDHAREVAMLKINVEAVADLCAIFLPGMVERGRGAILNVASTAAFQPMPGQAGYAASKSFVLAYGHGLRGELKGSGVTVTTLCPGPVDTGFGEAAGFTEEQMKMAPKFMWVSSADVALAAVDGMDKAKAVVIPGAANRVTAVAGYMTPKKVIVEAMARMHPSLRK